jgi:Ca2+-binding RTX toxin-like protein
MLVLAASAGTALAATLTGGGSNNTIIGTPSVADTINDGGGNDIIYGLGGGDTIKAGGGNDQIDADGQCTQGYDTVTPGSSEANYCQHGQGNPKERRSSIQAGGGDDTIFGGAGPNTISVGVGSMGNDLIYGGQVGDTISSSNGDNKIYLGKGSLYTGSTVSDGSGNSVIHAQNGKKDTISCARRNGTTVYADRVDVVSGCARVIYTNDPGAIPSPYPSQDRRSAKHSAVHKKNTKASARRH